MDIYKRYASGEHDKEYFAKHPEKFMRLRPLLGRFDNTGSPSVPKPVLYWQSLFPQAAFFAGFDPELFGYVVTMVYKSEATLKISAVSVTKFGCNTYENLLLDVRLRFWPACENLEHQHRDSNVRKALAIVNLKNHNQLFSNTESFNSRWDETNAGALASAMEVLTEKVPEELGNKLLELGMLQEHCVSSMLIDVVYDSKTPLNGHTTIEENNRLVFALGKQLDQLFDPLLEYAPQAMDYQYVPPRTTQRPILHNNVEVNKVLKELFDVQANYALDLVAILQDLINPIRAKVLSSDSSLGIQKVNLVFPPTIDEICRINCILHDSLNRAREFGYVEIFRVFENILPFFHKAFVRHEANLRNFHARLAKFLKKEDDLMSSPELNRGKFSARSIENIVSGSILELPRIKLILQRLHNVIEIEKAKQLNFEALDDYEKAQIDKSFDVCVQIIDSFGHNDPTTDKPLNNRVFTPSGKLLTEIATEWPVELQYGWINRKVISIHEVQEVIPTPAHSQLVIVFSDSVLFLDVFESDSKSIVLVPSVLMNSLINQKPLPKLSQFPLLKVKYWCSISDIHVNSYLNGNESFLCFMTFGESGFKDRNGLQVSPKHNYKVLDLTEESLVSYIQKAKVLHKVTTFHLFNDEEEKVSRFYCAHERAVYSEEISTSPVIILLNLNHDEIERIFESHPHAFLVLNASFINHHTIHISGHDRTMKYKVEVIVGMSELRTSLREVLSKSLDAFYHSTVLSDVLVQGNEKNLHYFVDRFSKQRSEKEPSPSTPKLELPKVEEKTMPEPELETEEPTRHGTVKRTTQPKEINQNVAPDVSCSSGLFFSDLIRKLKRKHTKKVKKEKLTPAEREVAAQRKIPDTEVPRGKKQVYDAIYKPTPKLRESSVSSTPKAEPEVNRRVISTKTDTSSYYTNTSLDVRSNFHFPLETVDELKERENGTSDTGDAYKIAVVEESNVNDNEPPLLTSEKSENSVKVLPKANSKPEPPQHRVKNEKKLFGEGGIPFLSKKRLFSSQDIANALENINAAGISPQTYAKYKMYEELPTTNFYSDGEANWVTVNREDSSNLEREVRAMKEEANMDTLDVIDVGNHGSPLRMVPQRIHNDSTDDTMSDNDELYLSQETVKATSELMQLDPPKLITSLPTEVSQESLNSLQYLNEFNRKLDAGFHLDDLLDQRSLPFTVDTIMVADESNVSENKAGAEISSTTSSEEYYSPDEYMTALRADYMAAEAFDMTKTVTLSSSEKTLMNVAREFEKKEEETGFQIKFDSVAYLSDILNGTVKI